MKGRPLANDQPEIVVFARTRRDCTGFCSARPGVATAHLAQVVVLAGTYVARRRRRFKSSMAHFCLA